MPLIDKDPKDPSNYYFAPTDHLIQLSRDIGLKIFYRLGTLIEHTGDIHFNAERPADYDKVAEIFSGIEILFLSAKTGEGVAALADWLLRQVREWTA